MVWVGAELITQLCTYIHIHIHIHTHTYTHYTNRHTHTAHNTDPPRAWGRAGRIISRHSCSHTM